MGLKHALPACSFGPRLVVACAHSFACMVGVDGAPWDREQKNLKKKSYGLNDKEPIFLSIDQSIAILIVCFFELLNILALFLLNMNTEVRKPTILYELLYLKYTFSAFDF